MMRFGFLLVFAFPLLALPAFAETNDWSGTTIKLYPLDHHLSAILIELGEDEHKATSSNAVKYSRSEVRDPFADPFVNPFAIAIPSAGPAVLPLTKSLQAFQPMPQPFRAHLVLGETFLAQTTDAGHAALAKLLDTLRSPTGAQQIEVTFSVLEIPLALVGKHPEFLQTASLSTTSVVALLREGKATLLDMASGTTMNGHNVQTESVEEIIYPTQFEIELSAFSAASIKTNSFTMVTPGAFETRETGAILNVTPSLMPDDKRIALAIIPEHCQLLGYLDYSDESKGKNPLILPSPTKVAQPVFRSFNLATSVLVTPGVPFVIGAAKHPKRPSMLYALVSARIVRP